MDANIRLDHQLLAVETEHQVHAMLEITAPGAPDGDKRAPLNIAIVIDRSGSMSGPKLEVTKQCADYLVKRLGKDDKVAVVAYDDQVDLVASLQPATGPALAPSIASIFPRGSTNLSGGWMKGAEELGRADEGSARKVILLTDGLANVGVTDPRALASMTQQAVGRGIGTTTVGFGEDFDEALLTDLAEVGQGNSYFASNPDDAPGIFGREFEGLMNLVAQNVSAEIRPLAEVQVLGILNDYPQTAVEGGVQVNLGDAYADEQRRLIFELHIPNITGLGVQKVADVVLRYTTVGEEIAAHEVTIPIVVNRVSADEANAEHPDNEVIEEVTILRTAEDEKQAREQADRGDYDGAAKRLRESAKRLRDLAPKSQRAYRLEEHAAKLEGYEQRISSGMHDRSSSKAMLYEMKRNSQHRSRYDERLEYMLMRSMRLRMTNPEEFAKRAEASLVGAACGNGLGVGVEGRNARSIKKDFGEVTEISAGESGREWDDDIAQTMCLAESLIANPMFDADDFARRLVTWADENGRGMGYLTREVIAALRSGIPAAEAANQVWESSGKNSAGNGAVMRFAPVPISVREPRMLVDIARRAAAVTHADPRCTWSAIALSVALSQVLVGEVPSVAELALSMGEAGAPEEVIKAIRKTSGAKLSALKLDDSKSMGYTLKTMQAALWTLEAPGSFEEKMVAIVSAGGDTDTNAAAAGAMAGALHGLDAIPQRWIDNLHDADKIRETARRLAGN
jgi:ADP-ribosylglycohydrolase